MKKFLCFLGASLLGFGIFSRANAYGDHYKISLLGDSKVEINEVISAIKPHDSYDDSSDKINLVFNVAEGEINLHSFMPATIRCSAVATIMCSVDNPESIDHVQDWLHITNKICPQCNKVFVINKSHLGNCDGVYKRLIHMGINKNLIVKVSTETGEGIGDLISIIKKQAVGSGILMNIGIDMNNNNTSTPKNHCYK